MDWQSSSGLSQCTCPAPAPARPARSGFQSVQRADSPFSPPGSPERKELNEKKNVAKSDRYSVG
jgi:hypothetical protein